MSEKAKLILPDGKSLELPILIGSENEKAIDIYDKPALDKVIEATTNLGYLSPLQDNGDGTYTSTYIANTTTAGKAKIVVKTEFDIQALTEILLIGGSTTNIELGISKSQLPADGKSTAQLRVKALDIYGNPVVNEKFVFELKPELNSGTVGDAINPQDGSYVVEYITGTAVGEVEIRAKSSYGVFDQTSIRLTLGDTANFQLSMDPPDAVADGLTPIDLILNVTDPHGNTIPNLSVAINVSSGKIIRTVDPIGNNNYRCINCGDTLEQKINGVIKYIKSPDRTTKLGLRSDCLDG